MSLAKKIKSGEIPDVSLEITDLMLAIRVLCEDDIYSPVLNRCKVINLGQFLLGPLYKVINDEEIQENMIEKELLGK